MINWFDRKFTLNLDISLLPNVIERLRGTPARLDYLLKQTSPPELVQRIGDSWSIQENVGHLSDLEPLWLARAQEIISREVRLREADLENNKTNEANHNNLPFSEIVSDFSRQRVELVSLVSQLSESQAMYASLHPRLMKPMRMIDLLYFVAEHDDHHLARISEIRKLRSAV